LRKKVTGGRRGREILHRIGGECCCRPPRKKRGEKKTLHSKKKKKPLVLFTLTSRGEGAFSLMKKRGRVQERKKGENMDGGGDGRGKVISKKTF